MEPIALGIAIGVGAAVALRRGREGMKTVVGWSARQIGWAASRVQAAVEDARVTAREEYQRGRELSTEHAGELHPEKLENGAAGKPTPENGARSAAS